MDKMLAAVWYGPGRENFRVEEVEKPKINPREILVRVRACYFGATHVRAILKGHPKFKPPLIEGRMVAGDVVEVGSEVKNIRKSMGEVREGMRVTVNPEVPCSKCYYCLKDEPVHCLNLTKLSPGGLAEHIRISEPLVSGVFELPKDVSYEEGAYTETLACVLYGALQSNITFGDTVVIIGCGGVGLTFVQLVKNQGAAQIVVSDIDDSSLQKGKKLEATHTVNVKVNSLVETVKELTGGHGADVVIEAVGSTQTYQETFDLVRGGGTIVAFGGSPLGSEFMIDPNVIHYRSLKIVGTYHYRPVLFRRALEMISYGIIDLDPIITHRLSLKEIHKGIDLYGKPECKTIVIQP